MPEEKMKPKIKIGQLWRLVKPERYNAGFNEDIFVVLAGQPPLENTEVWSVGIFWWSGEKAEMLEGWGGARQYDFTESDIHDIGEYVGYLPEILATRPSESVEEVIEKFDKDFPTIDSLHRNMFKDWLRAHLSPPRRLGVEKIAQCIYKFHLDKCQDTIDKMEENLKTFSIDTATKAMMFSASEQLKERLKVISLELSQEIYALQSEGEQGGRVDNDQRG